MEKANSAIIGQLTDLDEKDLSFKYESSNINKFNICQGFNQSSIKEEFHDEISGMTNTDYFSISDSWSEATNIHINDNDDKINYMKEEPVLEKNIKVENESMDNEYYHSELDDTKHNIDIKDNIIESSVVNSNSTNTSVYEDGNKHGSRNYFGRETTSLTDTKTLLTCEANGKILHERRHNKYKKSELKNYQCHDCKKTFTTSQILGRHIGSTHEGITYQCEECKKCFTHQRYLRIHIQTVHDRSRNKECEICKKTFTTSGSLKVHISSIHEGITYKCEECKKCFTHRRYLRMHIQLVHDRSRKKECQKCKKTFTTPVGLKIHISSIHQGIKYECQECKKTFSQSGTLRKHHKTVHSGKHHKTVYSRVRLFKCQKCNKTFTTSEKLKVHISSVHKGITYKCEECKKCFAHRRYLRIHIQIVHDRSKNKKCQKCKKTFTTSGSLKIHTENIHQGIKYECHKCKKTFSESGNLRKHIQKVHDRNKKI